MTALEICAGAGGQALGLEQAGFRHVLAVELDAWACNTLRANLGADVVRHGDVADPSVWDPRDFREQIDLVAGGVPCPPFSVAGRQHGATDERDLFAWAVELADSVRPRALMLENVRGLSASRFAAYRQHVKDRLAQLGYVADWRLLQASDFGVPQLRPRFVLIAMRPEDWSFFRWPEARPSGETVGSSLKALMSERGWQHADEWAETANRIAPTLVGGSKKHGGADLGPTRAKTAWLELGVDGKGLADLAPAKDAPHFSVRPPRLTIEMVARLQGWSDSQPEHVRWIENLAGGKTARYRQLGNAFPPPVARSLGSSIRAALNHEGQAVPPPPADDNVHDPVYRVLASSKRHLTTAEIQSASSVKLDRDTVARSLAHLAEDFVLDTTETSAGVAYRLVKFKAFTGQADHRRHDYLRDQRSRVS